MDPDQMDFDTVMHFIAQGAINVASGYNYIDAGSPVHRAMERLCELVNSGEVGRIYQEKTKS